jgi:hypothetical protein
MQQFRASSAQFPSNFFWEKGRVPIKGAKAADLKKKL